jgi:hypothetical protein
MRWAKSCFLAAGAAVLACSSPPLVPRAPPPRLVARPPTAVAAWPDVARDARAEKSGAGDAVVVVAVEPRATLPGSPSARPSADDWVRFFPAVLGVPPERVTALFDGAATR